MNEDNKNNKDNIKIPVDFWNKKRPNVSFDKILDDIEPIEWEYNPNDEIMVYSKSEDNVKK